MLFRGTIYSATLGMETGLTVIGPDGGRTDIPYAAAYVLHGLGGNAASWADKTRLPLYAEQYHTLFFLPEVQRSFYTDMRYGAPFLQYLTEELPQICENWFQISRKREDTAVIGGSVGGYGALKCAFHAPARFGACAALAPDRLFLGEEMDEMRQMPREQAESRWDAALLRDFTAIFGTELALCPQDNPLRLAEKAALHGDAPRLLLTCGKQDVRLDDCRHYHEVLGMLGIAHTYIEQDGMHDWYYFDVALQHALQWLYGTSSENK